MPALFHPTLTTITVGEIININTGPHSFYLPRTIWHTTTVSWRNSSNELARLVRDLYGSGSNVYESKRETESLANWPASLCLDHVSGFPPCCGIRVTYKMCRAGPHRTTTYGGVEYLDGLHVTVRAGETTYHIYFARKGGGEVEVLRYTYLGV
jgi:hypothetical protein